MLVRRLHLVRLQSTELVQAKLCLEGAREEKRRKEKKRKEKKRKEKKRKEKKRKDYAFRRQFNEKPSCIPGCPDLRQQQQLQGMLRIIGRTCAVHELCPASATLKLGL